MHDIPIRNLALGMLNLFLFLVFFTSFIREQFQEDKRGQLPGVTIFMIAATGTAAVYFLMVFILTVVAAIHT